MEWFRQKDNREFVAGKTYRRKMPIDYGKVAFVISVIVLGLVTVAIFKIFFL